MQHPHPRQPISGILAAMILGTLFSPASAAQDLDNLCTRFPQNSRCEGFQPQPWKANPALGKGEAIAEHERNRFLGQVLIPLPQGQVWQVLTDYNSFSEFLPGVIENQAIVTNQGENTRSLIMTSTSQTQVFLARVESSIELELQEIDQDQIEFSLVSGDNLNQLNGSWQLQTITPPDTAEFQGLDSVTLVTYRANATTNAGPQGIFANIFKSQIRTNLDAIQQETIRRFAS